MVRKGQEIKKQYTNEELLEILRKYNKEVSFPTQRKFKSSNGLPSYRTYTDRFGTFQNAILLSGIEIPENRQRYFNRVEYDREYLLKVFKEQVDISIRERNKLITDDEIDENKNLPSASVYYKHFSTLDNLYSLIGIDKQKFNNDKLEEDMKKKYIELKEILGRTPHSRDFDKYSKDSDYWYSCNAYTNHFGSIQNLQKLMGDDPYILGKAIEKQEMLDRLIQLSEELGCQPTQKDIYYCEYTPSINKYKKEFGSISNALYILGFKPNNKILISPKGNKALSGYEYRFLLMLEKYNIKFEKEVYYKDYVKSFNRKYRFDFKIEFDNKVYFIEIFGIDENKSYDKKTAEKKQLCKDNNLKLIDLYGYDLLKSTDDIYEMLIEKINKIKEEI